MTKAKFWDQKIIGWESKRYARGLGYSSALSRRLEVSLGILNARATGSTLLDLGCGTGTLFAKLNAADFKLLVGIDFSRSAIESARARVLPENVIFEQRDICVGELPPSDWVTGLGLLDWLEPESIKKMFAAVQGRKFIFSFSDKKRSLQRVAHQVFVFTSYGWRQRAYVPRYFSASEILALAAPSHRGRLYIFREPRLGLGALLSNFPIATSEAHVHPSL